MIPNQELLKEAPAALIAVAVKEGKQVSEIRASITEAIQVAMQNNDPNIQKKLAEIPRKGTTITPEEFLAYLIDQTRKRQ